MKRNPLVVQAVSVALAGFLGWLNESSGAAIWTNRNDGLWQQGANWSGGLAPHLGLGSTFITNANSKTVTVEAATPVTNLFINSLTLAGPGATTNTLFLKDVGLDKPLVVSNATFNIYRGGALRITNSSLLVTGRFISLNLWMGDVTLESGSLVAREEPVTTNVTVITRIGRTNRATVTVNGGLMQASQMLVGESPGAQFGRSSGTVRVRGGELRVTGELSIADSASCTGIVEVTGGQLTVLNQQTNVMRVADYGWGELMVSNAIASVGNVSVARHDGAFGSVKLLSNGVMTCSDDFSIGRFSGGTGLVLVAGGQLLVTNHPIWVGREGVGELLLSNGLVQVESLHVAIVPTNTARGTLTLDGGTLLVTSNYCQGDAALSLGSATLRGGELLVSNAQHSATLAVVAGTLELSGARVTTDDLVLTNAAGRVTFNSGHWRARSSRVANSAPFVVGDGVHAATLELAGGVHTFANGLVISRNATLSGCGTIVGAVTNFGTIATNCGPAGTAPSLTQQPVSLTVTQGATASFSVVAGGDPPLGYQWRFRAPGASEVDLAGATLSTLTFPNAQPNQAGAYRVLVSNSFGAVTSAVAELRVLVSPALGSVAFAAGHLSFSFPSVANLTYSIEYKDQLEAPAWIVLSVQNGTGGIISYTDPGSAQTRFYRVHVE
jgi:T5SS/PEP-CTERM-associated repeat protein